MKYKELLITIWNSIYDPKTDLIKVIDQFFHPDYEQCINGIYMNRNQYIDHVYEQRKTMIIDSIDYKHILENDNEVFALYYPKGWNTNNSPVEAEVIAYFLFQHQQLLKIHGQVRLLKGNLIDVDMEIT